jgi:hypothetical protein
MARQSQTTTSSIVENLLKGAIAGAAGIAALDLVTEWMTSAQPEESPEREAQARPDALESAHVVANRVAEATGTELEPRQPHPAGRATHFAIGMLPAAAYAAFRQREGFSLGRGLLLGIGMFAQYEGVNYMFDLSGAPNRFPWQAHARGVLGHAAYGAVTEGALAGLDEVANRARELARRGQHEVEETLDERRRERMERHAAARREDRRSLQS